jgi:hypothetical protein
MLTHNYVSTSNTSNIDQVFTLRMVEKQRFRGVFPTETTPTYRLLIFSQTVNLFRNTSFCALIVDKIKNSTFAPDF